MSKNLFLLRHADAAAKEGRQDDKSRELTQTGIQASRHMGSWFLAEEYHFDLMISSSAVRAEQTINLVAEGMKIDGARILLEDVLYDASVAQFLTYINNIEDAYHQVIIAGHNPAISYLAEYLTKADIGNMTPGSVAILKFDFNSWKHVSENTGELVRYVTPEMINQ